MALALDVAATELYKDERYHLSSEGRDMSSDEFVDYLDALEKYPIVSIEDGLAEDDWSGWANITSKTAEGQLVGDDLYVTNVERLERGIREKAGNSILIKVNHIGTLSETLEAITLARQSQFGIIVSHRSGETEDATIADLAVHKRGPDQNGLSITCDRTAKYNQLLRIEEDENGPLRATPG